MIECISPAVESGLFLYLSFAKKMQWMMVCKFLRNLACFSSLSQTLVSAMRIKLANLLEDERSCEIRLVDPTEAVPDQPAFSQPFTRCMTSQAEIS